MKKTLPFSLFVWLPWSFAACGLLITVGNLLGLAGKSLHLFPAVDDTAGLAASSLFLFGCGVLAHLVRPYFKVRP